MTGNGLFWDVHDYPIPGGLSAESIYLNLGSSLSDKSRVGDVSIWAYGERQTFPADSDPHSRFKLGFVPDGEFLFLKLSLNTLFSVFSVCN